MIPLAFLLSLIPHVFGPEVLRSDPITIDGFFDDWAAVAVAYVDAQGDGVQEDVIELKITNDDAFLYLNLTFSTPEFHLRRGNEFRLYIDADHNPETGLAIHGIGAELEWCFGCGNGVFHADQDTTGIGPNSLTLRMLPSYMAQQFEVAFSLESAPLTREGALRPDTLSLVLVSSDGTDVLPDEPGGVEYVIDPTPVDVTILPLARLQEDHLRLVSYNVERSGTFDAARQPAFERIFKALDPDIVALQEQRAGQQLEALFRDWLETTDLWSVSLGGGNTLVSKYPILQSADLITTMRTGAILLDTEAVLGTPLLVINTHLIPFDPAASQADADELIMVLREWRSGNGPFELPPNTPIVHVGDFNLAGPSQLLKTIRDGDISDEAQFGADAPPDWDDTPIQDLNSRQTALRVGFTTSRNVSNAGAKLDYIFFTDSVIELGNHYILNTTAMTEEDLTTNALAAADTDTASDHLPRVIDIARALSVSTEPEGTVPDDFRLFPAYPNPFHPSTTIRYTIGRASHVSVHVYDLLGRRVASLVDAYHPQGTYQQSLDASDLTSGVYIVKLTAGDFVQSMPVVLMK